MFIVRKSTYVALRNEYAKARAELIIAETRAAAFKKALDAQLTQAEIMTLIKLCHPDKHARSEDDVKDATEITSKLLKMRRKKAA